MKIYTLRNDFHNTTVNVRAQGVQHIWNEINIKLSPSQIKRAKKALCGVAWCACGNDAGMRGNQYTDNGKRLIVDAYGM